MLTQRKQNSTFQNDAFEAKTDEYYETRVVEIYIEFNGIGVVDTLNENYRADVYIEAKWIDDSVADVYDPNVHWNPMLSIENALDLSKNNVTYKIEKDNSNKTVITEMRRAKGTFWERLELHDFPIDIQELSISIVSTLNSYEVKIVPDKNKPSFIDLDTKHTFTDQQKW